MLKHKLFFSICICKHHASRNFFFYKKEKHPDQKDILTVQAVLDGDTGKFARIMERFRPHLVQRYFKKVNDRDVAEDLASEALCRAYERIHMYRPTHTFSVVLLRRRPVPNRLVPQGGVEVQDGERIIG